MKKKIFSIKFFVGAILLLLAWFGFYEFIERFYLAKYYRDILSVFHIFRGILAAIFMSIFVLRYFSLPRLSLYPVKNKSDTTINSLFTDADIFNYHIQWLILLRGFVIIMLLILSFLACYIFNYLEMKLFIPLVIIAIFLIILNISYKIISKSNISKTKILIAQIIFDLILLTAILHFSGGIENPFIFLYLFHVVISGILLKKKICYFISFIVVALFSLLVLLEMNHVLVHYTLSIFPHEEEIIYLNNKHAAFNPLYITTHIIAQCLIAFLTAFFITENTFQLNKTRSLALNSAQQVVLEHKKLIGIIEATGVGLAIIDNKNHFEWIKTTSKYWNKKLEKILKLTILGLFKKNRAYFSSVKDRKNKILHSIETEYQDKNGGVLYFRVSLFILEKKTGDFFSIAALVQDITNQKNIMNQLIQASKMKAIGELAGNVAHEINNPIGIISAKSSLLLKKFSDQLPEKVKSEITKVINLSNRVTNITTGLLRFSRPPPINKSIVDINQVIISTLDLIDSSLKSAKIDVHFENKFQHIFVLSDYNNLQQSFINIITNAKDAMSGGGELLIKTVIEKSIENNNENNNENKRIVKITFEDNGIGIKPKNINKIFEPFFTTKDVEHGTGLGLSICKGIIESYNGNIMVESRINVGTKFIITFPHYYKETEV